MQENGHDQAQGNSMLTLHMSQLCNHAGIWTLQNVLWRVSWSDVTWQESYSE